MGQSVDYTDRMKKRSMQITDGSDISQDYDLVNIKIEEASLPQSTRNQEHIVINNSFGS